MREERGALPEGSIKSDHDLATLKVTMTMTMTMTITMTILQAKADLGREDFAGKGDKEFWWVNKVTILT